MFCIIFYTFLDGTEPFIRQRKNNIPQGSFTAAHQSVKIQRCSGRSLAKQGRSLIFGRKHETTSGGASGAHHAAHAGSLRKNTDTTPSDAAEDSGTTLTYGSADYTRINPAMDEHGEINLLLFDGLTAHDGENNVVPGLAETWELDEATNTYTFHLRENLTWHDGEPVTADDVKFTIEAIMDPENGSENAPNFEDVEEITVTDDHTVSFRLSAPNVAFLDYMTMAVLPEHLLAGEDWQESDFFRAPVGTGPYKLERWDVGQAIILTKNENYYKGAPKIDRIVFKIVPDDNAQALQLESGELDLALLDPKNAAQFTGKDGFTCYDMKTSDYRGILFNFWNDYWTENRDIIPAICYAIDRQAIVDAVLLGQGMPAYGPLQRNVYNNENVEHYDYNPEKAKQLLEDAGCVMGASGYYERGGAEIAFTISVMSGEQDRIDIAQAAAQQLREVGIHCTVDIPAVMDWGGQMACLIGWGSRLTRTITPTRFSARTRARTTPAIRTPRSMRLSPKHASRAILPCASSITTNSRSRWRTTRPMPSSATSTRTTSRRAVCTASTRKRSWGTTASASSGTSKRGHSIKKYPNSSNRNRAGHRSGDAPCVCRL